MLEMELILVGDYCSWSYYGNFICDFIPSWSHHYQIPRSLSSRPTNEITLHHPNFHIPSRPCGDGFRNLPLNRHSIHLLPYIIPCPHDLQIDQIFGISIIGLIFVQLGFGYYHHRRFLKDRPQSRRWFTYVHLWLGRTIIVCGLANCGCGLLLALVSWKYVIIWWSVCGALAILYAVVSLVTNGFRARKKGEPFGNANGPAYSPERYKQAETYEMMNSRRNNPERRI
jgi:hypothetical protein